MTSVAGQANQENENTVVSLLNDDGGVGQIVVSTGAETVVISMAGGATPAITSSSPSEVLSDCLDFSALSPPLSPLMLDQITNPFESAIGPSLSASPVMQDLSAFIDTLDLSTNSNTPKPFYRVYEMIIDDDGGIEIIGYTFYYDPVT